VFLCDVVAEMTQAIIYNLFDDLWQVIEDVLNIVLQMKQGENALAMSI
jgi:uncharacterized membrane protein